MRMLELLTHIRNCREIRKWGIRQYAPPSPEFIKQQVLLRNGIPNSIWIETGTYLGRMTKFIASYARHVYTIEPDISLCTTSTRLLGHLQNVNVWNGSSEEILPELLPKLKGDISFWLDGHYSAGVTYKGPKDTPILDELNCISLNRGKFDRLCVLIDDVRCFDPLLKDYSTYPSIDSLIKWADQEKMRWHIEHDIFVAHSSE